MDWKVVPRNRRTEIWQGCDGGNKKLKWKVCDGLGKGGCATGKAVVIRMDAGMRSDEGDSHSDKYT
jgi:hypothetical protein